MKCENSPPNLKEGNIIKALGNFVLHLVDRCRAPCYTETKLCSSSVLLDEIKFTVILRIEVAQMAARLNQLLKLGLLRHEIGLKKEEASATTVNVASVTTTRAIGKKISVGRPQTTLPNDDLHALEPAGHGGVVLREIKYMWLAVWECAIAHG